MRIGRLRLRQLTHSHVQGWVRELKHQARQDDPDWLLAPYSIRNAFAVLRAALNSEVKDGLIPFNPCRNVNCPRRSKPAEAASTRSGQKVSADVHAGSSSSPGA